MSLSESMTPADFAAISGNNDGFGGSAWWIIILFLFAFCGGWGGNGFGGSGANENYVLTSDFATLQRMISDGNNMIERKLDNQNSGICELGYTQAQLINGVNQSIAGVNYNMAMNSNATQSAIQNGFCTTNFNNQTNTRDIIDAQASSTRAILDAIQQNKVEALNQRISEQAQQINALQLSASQTAQNSYLLSRLQPTPVPSYPASQLYGYCGCGCNC